MRRSLCASPRRAASAVLVLAGTLALGGCAVAPPTGPSVVAMPAQGKSLADFHQDDVACRQYAFSDIGVAPAAAAQQSAVNSAALGTALGAAAGALLGAAGGNAGVGAAIGAGSGLLFGGAAGAGAAETSSAGLQRRYDIAYAQCMSSKGDSVPAVAAGTYYTYPVYPRYYYYPYAYPYYPYPAFYGPSFLSLGFSFRSGGHRHHHHWR